MDPNEGSNSSSQSIRELCDHFRATLGNGDFPSIEALLESVPSKHLAAAIRELVRIEVGHLKKQNKRVDQEKYVRRFPQFSQAIDDAFNLLTDADGESRVLEVTRTSDHEFDVGSSEFEMWTNDSALPAANNDTTIPDRIGRYQIRRVLGTGGFGRVFLAHDSQLDRLVALKVPRQNLFDNGTAVNVFLEEARNAAKLNHPGLVAVYDAQIEDDQPYVVQEFVDGSNLAEWIRSRDHTVSNQHCVQLVKDIAEALGAAHACGLVHRDLKPANILMDTNNKPHVADFGLALREGMQRHRQGEVSGTPAYMSPEQVRGESHLLDGRTDLWSLGVIFYQLLVNKRPFSGANRDELYHEIQYRDPQPPSMVKPELKIDAELERICLKCLRKRSSERFPSAARLIDDLQHWLDTKPNGHSGSLAVTAGNSDQTIGSSDADSSKLHPVDEIAIVPKGLRSFDGGDSDFFLELLPGPRDRHGLPDTIRSWKSKIEQTHSDDTFRVGLIYGPSGCGKSSFVKAGLLPVLKDVVPIYVEATPNETELRLRKGILKHDPNADLPDLVDVIRFLRQRSKYDPKVLLVIDQFEQWLHTHREEPFSQLVDALRQCDGERVQCILMVRDDFWMAISQFMNQLEIPIESQNSAAVDLFDRQHAEKVLTALGRAFGQLPKHPAELSPDQQQFVEQAVLDLCENNKVICVRLSLFADMMKGRPWNPSELKKVGGTEGVGATFLEETFSATSAPPQHRVHQTAARQVLAALLPNSGAEIKGHMRSREELLDAAEYRTRLGDFQNLLTLLDRDLRLVTPTDPDSVAGVVNDDSDTEATGQTYYQLTHDYLVPSLRAWLTRKQKETRRGRAELQLAERSERWNSRRENRQLPSPWEFLNLRLLTKRSKWTELHSRMMKTAGRYYGIRLAGVAAVLAGLILGGLNLQSRFQARSLVAQLATAKPTDVNSISKQVQPYLANARPLLDSLVNAAGRSEKEIQQKLHARIALAASDESQVRPLIDAALESHPSYIGPIRDALLPYKSKVAKELWSIFSDSKIGNAKRFRAALVLAVFDPTSSEWTPDKTDFVARELVGFNPEHQPQLREYLRPVAAKLLTDLEILFRESSESEALRVASASALADFIETDLVRLTGLLIEATPKQFEIIWPRIANTGMPEIKVFLNKLLTKAPPAGLGNAERIRLGIRRAGAAIALVRKGARESIQPILQTSTDREATTQFVHRFRDRQINAAEVLEIFYRLKSESPRGRYGLILMLGEFAATDFEGPDRASMIETLADWYANDTRSGIHGAAGWLLRQWGQDAIVSNVDQAPVPYSRDREWFNVVITTTPSKINAAAEPSENASDEKSEEFVPQTFSYTFIVFQPGKFRFGSPESEPGRGNDEFLHQAKLTKPIAMLDREITFAEMIACQQHVDFNYKFEQVFPGYGTNPKTAVMAANWYDAIRFCRWLTAQAGFEDSDQCYADPSSLDPEEYPIDDRGNAPRNWPLDRARPGFRLPTEHEWEVACRAGTSTVYEFGSDPDLLVHYGWFLGQSERLIHEPKQLRPSNRGMFDMHGNVWEWCQDWHQEDTSEYKVDPVGPLQETYRVYRGGGWVHEATKARSADRRLHDPVTRGNDLGFRLAMIPSAVQSPDEKEN